MNPQTSSAIDPGHPQPDMAADERGLPAKMQYENASQLATNNSAS